ncbi:MAG: hypothetical protein Q9226_000751 [Calogaya cf. arnoldii]
MAHIMQQTGSILYQNKARTVMLIDIPLSISYSQSTPEYPCTELLYSDHPLENPYRSIEPRGQKAKQRVQDRLSDTGLTLPPFPSDWLSQGLAEIRAANPPPFCSERRIKLVPPTRLKKDQEQKDTSQLSEEGTQESEIRVPERRTGVWREPQGPLILSSSAVVEQHGIPQAKDLMNKVIANVSAGPILVHVDVPDRKYNIPPYSVFMLSFIGQREASHFSKMAVKLFPEPSISAAPGQFDFVLLDPPWENRSVRRSRTYASHRKADEDPLNILGGMLGKHLAPGALVACWTTNKPSVRDSALQAFGHWGVELVEEWAWLKITVHGEPICDLGGSMRRPYETVLVGRAFDATFDQLEDSTSAKPITKRLIVGVPDLHSRKPCLKEIIEPMMRSRSNYRALEIFARNLTAGWWSWGNEVLKYNWKGYWTESRRQDDTYCKAKLKVDAMARNETIDDVE